MISAADGVVEAGMAATRVSVVALAIEVGVGATMTFDQRYDVGITRFQEALPRDSRAW